MYISAENMVPYVFMPKKREIRDTFLAWQHQQLDSFGRRVHPIIRAVGNLRMRRIRSEPAVGGP